VVVALSFRVFVRGIPMPSYAAVLRTRHAVRTFVPALVGRLSYGIVFLSLVLAVTGSTGSYAMAGSFLALFGVTSSVLSPVRAMLIDRHGLRRALPPMALAYAILLSVIAAVTWRPGPPGLPLWVLAVASGALTPPLGPIMRSLWATMITDRDLRQRAFSLDTVAEELLYVTGPLLAGVFAAAANPALGVAVSAGLVLIGGLALAASPATSARLGSGPRTSLRLRAFAGLYRPVLVSAAVGMCLGALSLLMVAFAVRERHLAAAAWVEAALAVGSVVGGLGYGAITWRSSGQVRLPLLAGALGVLLAVSGVAPNLFVLAALVGVTGLFVSPALTTAYLIADEVVAPDARTQAGAWVNTAYNLANSVGAAGIGLLLGRFSLGLCFVLAGVPAAVAALTAFGRPARPA
jgi:predicted MFS family arabinose efflux permease